MDARKLEVLCIFLSMAVVGLSPLVVAIETQPDPRSEIAAKAEIVKLRMMITDKNFQFFGFESVNQANALADPDKVMGPPILITRVDLKPLKQFQPASDPKELNKRIEALVADPKRVFFPIIVEGKFRTALIMAYDQQKDQWGLKRSVDAHLAEQIYKYHDISESQLAVWVRPLNLYFFVKPSEEGFKLVPIANHPKFRFTAGVPLPAAQVFLALKNEAQNINEDSPT